MRFIALPLPGYKNAVYNLLYDHNIGYSRFSHLPQYNKATLSGACSFTSVSQQNVFFPCHIFLPMNSTYLSIPLPFPPLLNTPCLVCPWPHQNQTNPRVQKAILEAQNSSITTKSQFFSRKCQINVLRNVYISLEHHWIALNRYKHTLILLH